MKAAKVFLCISGIIMFLLGIVSLAMPEAVILTLAIVLGIGFLLTGILEILAFFIEKKELVSPGWTLFQGIIDVLAGVLILLNIPATVIMLPIIFGFWILFSGISRIVISFHLKKTGIDKWWVVLITGILAFIISMIVLIYPFAGAALIVAFIGGSLMAYGSMLFIETITTKLPENPENKA